MSFFCKACGRHRAGASGEVCTECWTTQMGAAAKILIWFENRRFGDAFITTLQNILIPPQVVGSMSSVLEPDVIPG